MRRQRRTGMTLAGLMVTCVIIGILMALVSMAVGNARRRGNEVASGSNLRQIVMALEMFHDKHGKYPDDFPEGDWVQALEPYLKDLAVIECPATREEDCFTDFSTFYVTRGEDEPDKVIMSSPLLGDGTYAQVVFGNWSVRRVDTEMAEWTPPGGGDTQWVMIGDEVTGGTLAFVDGSELEIEDAMTAKLIQSFWYDDDTLYSIVRIADDSQGTVSASVHTGSRFEVVSPSLVVAALGTKFWVRTFADSEGRIRSQCGVTESKIAVRDKELNREIKLIAPPSSGEQGDDDQDGQEGDGDDGNADDGDSGGSSGGDSGGDDGSDGGSDSDDDTSGGGSTDDGGSDDGGSSDDGTDSGDDSDDGSGGGTDDGGDDNGSDDGDATNDDDEKDEDDKKSDKEAEKERKEREKEMKREMERRRKEARKAEREGKKKG